MKTPLKLFTVVVVAIGFCLQFGEDCGAAVRKRSEYPFSATATYAGNINGALYIIDSQVIKQFDKTGRVRQSIKMATGRRYWFSPDGFHYLISGLSLAELETAGDTSQAQLSGIPNAQGGYALYNVLGQQLHAGRSPKSARFYLSSTGRYLITNPDVGSGVELYVFDSLGARIGLCHVAACDTVTFAPNERGFLVDAGLKGLFHFFFSGDRVASYPAADCYSFSLSGKRIATFRKGKVALYKLDTLLRSFSIPRPTASKIIYQDSRGRVFVLTKTHLFKLDTQNGIVKLDYPTIDEGRVFTDMAYSPKSDMLGLVINISRGSSAGKRQQSAGCALRVITPDGTEQPFYYILTNMTRAGFPRVQLKSTGRGALFLASEQAHNVDW